MYNAHLARLNQIAFDNNDVTLKSLVDLYRYQREDTYLSFEKFLLDAIETMSLAHKHTREAFAEHVTRTPAVITQILRCGADKPAPQPQQNNNPSLPNERFEDY